jgi:hypothetical protein
MAEPLMGWQYGDKRSGSLIRARRPLRTDIQDDLERQLAQWKRNNCFSKFQTLLLKRGEGCCEFRVLVFLSLNLSLSPVCDLPIDLDLSLQIL